MACATEPQSITHVPRSDGVLPLVCGRLCQVGTALAATYGRTCPQGKEEGPQTVQTTRGKRKKRPIEAAPWVWDEQCQQAFQGVIDRLVNPPTLAYPDHSKSFVLHTDSSFEGLGAALYQVHEGVERPVAYDSRTLSKTEKNYPVHKLEFLALKLAVTEKFSHYLYGHQFMVRTDNNPMSYVLTTAKLDATGHRWLATLANYHFTIQYRPGRKMVTLMSSPGGLSWKVKGTMKLTKTPWRQFSKDMALKVTAGRACLSLSAWRSKTPWQEQRQIPLLPQQAVRVPEAPREEVKSAGHHQDLPTHGAGLYGLPHTWDQQGWLWQYTCPNWPLHLLCTSNPNM